jgi:hypothetical protein
MRKVLALVRRSFFLDKKKRGIKPLFLAGVQGFEPQSADPESAVLPLNDTPMLPAKCIIPHPQKFCQPLS